ncbi:MAG TPA: cation diffusion facilitator family transporter [Gammaproteobacteria bacterium]|nr:cation diffusion facilitator family transporter [Gammaproteobacteria bacterium]
MHDHAHGHAHHHHGTDSLTTSLVLIVGFAGVEAGTGWWAGSLALMGDAGHMVTDATALGVAVLAQWVARRPPTERHSYGLGRAEVVAALLNGLFMMTVVGAIVVAAVDRLHTPERVAGLPVMVVALLGLIINVAVLLTLSRGEQNLNTRGAVLHVLGDLLGSIAALLSGAVIYFTGWTPIDPILSVLICLLILYSSLRLLRESLNVILEGVPAHLDLPQVGRAMAGVEGVQSVHDLHIWTLSSGMVALSAHVMIQQMEDWERVLERMQALLARQFHIEHITLQPEPMVRVLHPMSFQGAPSLEGDHRH